MDNPKVILTPDNQAIVVSSIYHVSEVYQNITERQPQYNCTFFKIYFANKQEYQYYYRHSLYADSPDVILSKVKNIRMEILKIMNDGIEPRRVLGNINLKKDGQE